MYIDKAFATFGDEKAKPKISLSKSNERQSGRSLTVS